MQIRSVDLKLDMAKMLYKFEFHVYIVEQRIVLG